MARGYKTLFSKEDLYKAYRKVKFELFNDKNSVGTHALLEYEQELQKNIEELAGKLQATGLSEISIPNYYEVPKSLMEKNDDEPKKAHFFSSFLGHNNNPKKIVELKFRKVINADVEFHIFSALWIAKIGQFIDEKFGKNIYGSRLVRIKPTDSDSCEEELSLQLYNEKSPRIFEPYQYKYQNWRNNSFKAIRELHETSSVIAVTMDIAGFYHSVELTRFKDNEFYTRFGLEEKFENQELKRFHEDFIGLLEEWNKKIGSDHGLPIGLSASPILANAVMVDFDKQIDEKLAPTYYGRYVDDILLVFPDCGNVGNGEDVIDNLVQKEIVKQSSKKNEETGKEEKVLTHDVFEFKQEKFKIFYLAKEADLSLIDAMEQEINAVSSEWRFMPDIADENSSLINKLVGFYADGKEFNDALRKIEAATIKRLGLSLLIGHSHSLNQYVSPGEWRDKREAIYDLIENHIFIPKNFFDNFMLVPRIFRLMVHSGDGERAFCFLDKTIRQMEVFKNLYIEVLKPSNGKEVDPKLFLEYGYHLLQEVFLESYNLSNKMSKRHAGKIIDKLFDGSSGVISAWSLENSSPNPQKIQSFNQKLFFRDLSFDGYAVTATEYVLTQNESSLYEKNKEGDPKDFDKDFFEIDFEFINTIGEFNKKLSIKHKYSNYPLIFPTRMFSPLDVSIVVGDDKNFLTYVNNLRGTHTNNSEVSSLDCKDNLSCVDYSKLKNAKSVNIAVTNFQVEEKYWKASVIQKANKSIERYKQLAEIVSDAVRKRPDYLVLPELAIPQEWAWLASKKLLANNISFVTGVEYIHGEEDKRKVVHNSIMMFLISDGIGFKHMRFFRQDKEKAAHGEAMELQKIAGIKLAPHPDYKDKKIFQHGNSFFSCLICNELTDISNRMKLRGEIDALIVVEWNQDIKSFNALVESASLDIHSYVVQVNNRKYGDSRVRAPGKEDYERDIVQVRGGEHDYLVVGKINIEALRDFQSHNISPDKPYKPIPTGFEMSSKRAKWKNSEKADS